jgi:alpha-ketoglutarate-dependent taurine dioxygenase
MTTITDSPFDLDNHSAYQAWREQKIANHPASLEELVVEVRDPQHLSEAEHSAILDLCRHTNMAIYAGPTGDDPDTHIIRDLGLQFGLERLDHNPGSDEDSISALSVQEDAYHRRYIPYTNRPIAWHTDGYYNTPERQIHGLLLHCVQPADEGGENDLLDHEMLYISLRDRNQEYIRALMHPEAMTIPANLVDGKETRPASPGPVFSIRPDGRLHMRYTDRTRSIAWRDDPVTAEAVSFLKEQLHAPGPWCFRGKLQAGQGLICNNVLHTRTSFTDGEHKRLLYRARSSDRISST